MAVFLCHPAGRIVAGFVPDGPFGEEECSDAVVRQVHRQDGPVVDGAEGPGAPENGEIDQCFCGNVRPAVEFGVRLLERWGLPLGCAAEAEECIVVSNTENTKFTQDVQNVMFVGNIQSPDRSGHSRGRLCCAVVLLFLIAHGLCILRRDCL